MKLFFKVSAVWLISSESSLDKGSDWATACRFVVLIVGTELLFKHFLETCWRKSLEIKCLLQIELHLVGFQDISRFVKSIHFCNITELLKGNLKKIWECLYGWRCFFIKFSTCGMRLLILQNFLDIFYHSLKLHKMKAFFNNLDAEICSFLLFFINLTFHDKICFIDIKIYFVHLKMKYFPRYFVADSLRKLFILATSQFLFCFHLFLFFFTF